MSSLVSRREVMSHLGISHNTVYRMIERGEIDAIKIGNKNFYNLEKYLLEHGLKQTPTLKKYCYCRVSSQGQKDDLTHQIELLKSLYPDHIFISDIGSGLNFKRKGLTKLINLAIKGEVSELVVTYKDRLARFGFDIIKYLIETYSDGRIIIVNALEEKTPMEEISEDIISIMNIYTAKINGLRKYKNKIQKSIENKEITHKN